MPSQMIYFADPMCSWCWGFAPVIKAAQDRYDGRLPIRLIVGGLRPGTTEPLDEKGKQSIQEHWRHVEELAGQPFDHGFFDRDGFVYDTEPACRAVVAARRVSAEAALPMLRRLHQAFYAENQDVTDRATLATLAEEIGLPRDRFEAEWDAEDTRRETATDFQITRDTGIQGYPALIVGGDENGYSLVTLGYQPWEKIGGALDNWLAQAQDGPAPEFEQSVKET